MKRVARIVLTLFCIALVITSWVVVLNRKSNNDKQIELLNEANALVNDEIYILAVPLLEEASYLQGDYSMDVKILLKDVYSELINVSGFKQKYTSLLEQLMLSDKTSSDIFIEAAEYYRSQSKLSMSMNIYKSGFDKTGDTILAQLYEKYRYEYKIGHRVYEDVTSILNQTIGVKNNGLWGIAMSDGSLLLPIEYDQVSTFSNGRAIVKKANQVFAVDKFNNRVALLKTKISEFGNYSNNRISLRTNEGWIMAMGDFQLGSSVFDELGTSSNGYIAAKKEGKWGLIDNQTEWLIEPVYDDILRDDLGRSYAQNAVFVRKGNEVFLCVDENQLPEEYEDARPFGDEGYAAVKRNGLWGFIDSTGEVIIDFQFEDAQSFSQHLAAVKQDELWGYISLKGELVITNRFIDAKGFSGGYAPVLTERGWQFIELLEFEKEVGL